MTSAQEEEEPRYYGLELGVVVDNRDPRGLSRVRIRIPGLMDETDWALPLGLPGAGGKQRGTQVTPPIGADVGVLFHRGNPEKPFYIAGNFGIGEQPKPVLEAMGNEPHRVAAFETERWLCTYDDRDDTATVSFVDKLSELRVDIDGQKLAITVAAETLVDIRCNGVINIDALEVQIQGRKVLRSDAPI